MIQTLTQFMLPILIITGIIMAILIEIEETGKATTLLMLIGGIFTFLHFKEVSEFFNLHIKEIVIGFFIYVFLGVCWSILKWTFFIKNLVYKIEKRKLKLEKDEHYKQNPRLVLENL